MENKTILEVNSLNKSYPAFSLKDVSFSVKEGRIMGFIGRNGAGKTTTMKSLLNMVHPDSGEVKVFGMNFLENEAEIKQRLGYASGGVNYYPQKKLKDIIAVTKTFYSNWDDEAYKHYMNYFKLDENKKPKELSEGMKVKFNLTIALSHHAEILLLDEPTSGLDPVSREELLEIFLELKDKGVAIFFSTHITSDLDKCADDITYIKAGEILSSDAADNFKDTYRLVHINENEKNNEKIIGKCRTKEGFTALCLKEDAEAFQGCTVEKPDLETIMVHIEKEAL